MPRNTVSCLFSFLSWWQFQHCYAKSLFMHMKQEDFGPLLFGASVEEKLPKFAF